MQSIVVYSAVGVLVALCLLMAIAVGREFPPGLADLFTTWLPAWLQGIGTIFAAYVAWQVWKRWREPDAGRRRAEVAEQLLKQAFVATRAMRSARRVWQLSGPGPTIGDVRVFAVGMNDHVTAMSGPVADLQVFLLLAKHHFGREMANHIVGLVNVERKIREAYRRLNNIHDEYGSIPDDQMEAVVRDFSIIGVQFDRPRNFLTDLITDDIDSEINSYLERIEGALEPFIIGKA